ncbi:MAG TPA: type II toxin-antitoxin system VapC family toxin [Candidatus Binatus sp.]|nr:type II toxin-antitoxin system VapC family toxin [Candidatus Binatus sp.]
MTNVVVDASVAVKWCLPSPREELVVEAEELLASSRRDEVRFLVPDLFWVELANALWKAVRRGEMSSGNAAAAMSFLRDLDIATFPSIDIVPQALDLAISQGRTVYDSLYVALALHSKSELITADERLANALAGHLPVKWLGAF